MEYLACKHPCTTYQATNKGLGYGHDRQGGVESRSDLNDLKSSKVDLTDDFLKKIE